MESYGTIRVFNTANFEVRVDALFEPDPDFGFEGGEETQAQVYAGALICFCARVSVIYGDLGAIGQSYLGNCIHENISDFEDHRECAAQTRKLHADGNQGICGSYFADMIREAIAEARGKLSEIQGVYVRKV